MKTIADQLVVFATSYGLKIVGAVLTLIIGRLVAGLARKGVKRLRKPLPAARRSPVQTGGWPAMISGQPVVPFAYSAML